MSFFKKTATVAVAGSLALGAFGATGVLAISQAHAQSAAQCDIMPTVAATAENPLELDQRDQSDDTLNANGRRIAEVVSFPNSPYTKVLPFTYLGGVREQNTADNSRPDTAFAGLAFTTNFREDPQKGRAFLPGCDRFVQFPLHVKWVQGEPKKHSGAQAGAVDTQPAPATDLEKLRSDTRNSLSSFGEQVRSELLKYLETADTENKIKATLSLAQAAGRGPNGIPNFKDSVNGSSQFTADEKTSLTQLADKVAAVLSGAPQGSSSPNVCDVHDKYKAVTTTTPDNPVEIRIGDDGAIYTENARRIAETISVPNSPFTKVKSTEFEGLAPKFRHRNDSIDGTTDTFYADFRDPASKPKTEQTIGIFFPDCGQFHEITVHVKWVEGDPKPFQPAQPPKNDPPKNDPPKQDPPKNDPPKQDPPKQDPPKQDPPKQDPPKQDPPKNDPPKNDPPKNDPPKNDPPKNEPPKQDPPKQDPPKNDPPKQDPPKNDPPKQEPPKQDPPKTDPPKTDPPKNVASLAEARKRAKAALAAATKLNDKQREILNKHIDAADTENKIKGAGAVAFVFEQYSGNPAQAKQELAKLPNLTPAEKDSISKLADGVFAAATPVQTPPKPVEPPKNDPPKQDPPKTDPPKVEPPKNDPPKQDPPKVEPPKSNVPSATDPVYDNVVVILPDGTATIKGKKVDTVTVLLASAAAIKAQGFVPGEKVTVTVAGTSAVVTADQNGVATFALPADLAVGEQKFVLAGAAHKASLTVTVAPNPNAKQNAPQKPEKQDDKKGDKDKKDDKKKLAETGADASALLVAAGILTVAGVAGLIVARRRKA